jgi:hypothetical protein
MVPVGEIRLCRTQLHAERPRFDLGVTPAGQRIACDEHASGGAR